MTRVRIGGLPIVRMTGAQLCDRMVADVAAARAGQLALPRLVTSGNGSVIARYHQNAAFREAINAFDIIDADGMPLVFASRWLTSTPLPERIATTDWFLAAAEEAARHKIRFYLLGGRAGVAQRAGQHLASRFPGLDIAGTRHGYFRQDEIEAICADIRASGADVLWVGMGSPLQESFALAARPHLGGLGWIRTCGGLFDHFGGGVSRAPVWMQAWGLEWAYRAAREPVRLGLRYLLTNPVAVYHLLRDTGDTDMTSDGHA